MPNWNFPDASVTATVVTAPSADTTTLATGNPRSSRTTPEIDPGAAEEDRRTTGAADTGAAFTCADANPGVPTTKRPPTKAEATKLVAPVILFYRGD